MAAKEKNTWAFLKAAREQAEGSCHIARVENSVVSGHPDVEGCWTGTQFWIELKAGKRPARPTSKVRTANLRPSQVEWMTRRVEAGCRTCWFLVQVGSGHGRAMYLIPGWQHTKIKEKVSEEWLAMNGQRFSGSFRAIDVVVAACRAFDYFD